MIVEILNKVKRLYTDFSTNSRIAKLDALGLPSGKIVPNGTDDWTSTRAGYLTTINSRMPASTIASSTEVAKVGDGWNSTLATKLNSLRKIPQVKLAANCLNDFGISPTSQSFYFFIDGVNAVSGQIYQGYGGFQRAFNGPTVNDVYADVVNISGAGWIYGVMGVIAVNSTATLGVKLIVDGVVACETNYNPHNAYQNRILLGFPFYAGTQNLPRISPIPLRFDSTLQVQVKGNPFNNVKGCVVYTLD